ncbi:hypothetical protein KQI63_14920 [bacterium]|nr:hypothetical protein [bacterium]
MKRILRSRDIGLYQRAFSISAFSLGFIFFMCVSISQAQIVPKSQDKVGKVGQTSGFIQGLIAEAVGDSAKLEKQIVRKLAEEAGIYEEMEGEHKNEISQLSSENESLREQIKDEEVKRALDKYLYFSLGTSVDLSGNDDQTDFDLNNDFYYMNVRFNLEKALKVELKYASPIGFILFPVDKMVSLYHRFTGYEESLERGWDGESVDTARLTVELSVVQNKSYLSDANRDVYEPDSKFSNVREFIYDINIENFMMDMYIFKEQNESYPIFEYGVRSITYETETKINELSTNATVVDTTVNKKYRSNQYFGGAGYRFRKKDTGYAVQLDLIGFAGWDTEQEKLDAGYGGFIYGLHIHAEAREFYVLGLCFGVDIRYTAPQVGIVPSTVDYRLDRTINISRLEYSIYAAKQITFSSLFGVLRGGTGS